MMRVRGFSLCRIVLPAGNAKKLPGFLLGALFLAPSALAQSTNYSTLEVTSGEPARVGFYGFATKTCASEPLPVLDVVTPPKHGVVTVRAGSVTATKVANCPAVQVQVQVVFYRATANYVGPDQVVFSVKKQDGVVDVYSVSLTVNAPQPPPPSNL
jgi:hypothetical protein